MGKEDPGTSYGGLDANHRAEFISEFANPDETARFEFENLAYTVKDRSNKGAEKDILCNVSGAIGAGEVLAVLGPSGSGKTTLLNLLTLEPGSGTPHGAVTLNGSTLDRDSFQQHCFYVPAEGAHWAFLTPREVLTTTAKLYNDDGSDAINRRVSTLLTVFGLEVCADVKVGNAFFKGLSGGQKKRLTVAQAMLSKPLVAILDEPTSGLDSASAAGVMTFLKDLAQAANMMIICTIHQPSSSVFQGFDRVLLLSEGQTAYFGTAAAVAPYFQTIGREVPAHANAAEFLLDEVNAEFSSKERVDEVLNAWAATKGGGVSGTGSSAPKGGHGQALAKGARGSGFASQLVTLLARHTKLVIRDPTLYMARIVIFLMMAIGFGVIYINMRFRDQDQVLNRMWVILWYLGPPCSMAAICVYATNIEFHTVRNELRNGMTNPFAYMLAKTIIQIPCMLIVTACGFVIPLFGISNMDISGLPVQIALLAGTFWCFETAAEMMAIQFKPPWGVIEGAVFGTAPTASDWVMPPRAPAPLGWCLWILLRDPAAPRNYLLGLMGVMNLWFMSFIFSGIMVRQEDVPWPWRFFMWVLPIKYGFRSMMYEEFVGTNYDGTVPDATATRGWSCPSTPAAQCYGPDGLEILDSLNKSWGAISSELTLAKDFLILLGIGMFFKIQYCMLVFMAGSKVAMPKPRAESPPPAGNNNGRVSPDREKGAAAGPAVPPGTKLPSADISADDHAAFVREFANPDGNALFAFSNVQFEVDDKKDKKAGGPGVKQILKGISGTVKAGEVLAVLGPSGAGKTTLLTSLTLEPSTGKSYGNVTLNGQSLTREQFQKHCYYVPQFPTTYAFLTPRETLILAGKLYDSDTEAVHRRAETLLKVMGLRDCADIKIGNQFFHGLSAGQNKRLAVACGLMSRPLVIFLDEPTTSIDAAAAAGIMKFLRYLAESAKICVMCTIHQPSSAVFDGFDNVMLLARGEVAFTGGAKGVVPHFESMGASLPDNTTPAEFMLDLVNDEFTDPVKVRALLDGWATMEKNDGEGGAAGRAEKLSIHASQVDHHERDDKGVGLGAQVGILLERKMKLVARDPMLYLGRAAGYLMNNLFFCWIYFSSRDREQSRVVTRMFNQMWCVGSCTSMALIIVFSASAELVAIKNEVKNGMVKPMALVISNQIIQLPLLLIMVCVGYLLPLYGLMDANPDHIIKIICLLTAIHWAFEATAEAFGVMFENMLIGMLNFMQFWFATFLFSGIVVGESQVPWPFRALVYVSPLRWGLRSVVHYDIIDDVFDGAVLRADAPSGFICPDDKSGGSACFGYTGDQVLDSLTNNFENFSAKNTFSTDIIMCIVVACAFKAAYVALLFMRANAHLLPVLRS